MSKSLYGYEKQQTERKVHQDESVRHFKTYYGVVQYIISSYNQLEDLPPNIYAALKKELSFDLEVISGLHFVVLMQSNEYVLLRSPYEEPELRCIYGSDGNIKGRLIEVQALDSSLFSISKSVNVRFMGTSRYKLQDPDECLPISTAGLYGHKIDGRNKMNAFKRNKRSGMGIIK